MATSAVDLSINYSNYTEAQLCAMLDEIQTQKASLDNKERQIREILHSMPNDETAFDLKNAVTLTEYTSHEQLVRELQAEIESEK